MNKQQVILIHGGETFIDYKQYLGSLKEMVFDLQKELKRNKRWNRQLGNKLGEDYEFIFPTMPNKYNAKYEEWKIWFEKVLDYVDDNFILIGYSLGGTFLLKYLSENNISKKITALFLISSAIEKENDGYNLDTFALDLEKVKKIESKFEKITIIHSQDDDIVPFSDFQILEKLLPQAEKMVFTDRGHFMGEEFPELAEEIKK